MLAAAVVMTSCLAIAGGVLLLVLYRSLESTAQGAAAARAEQISAQLRSDTPREVDPSLLVTDSQVGAVQIVDATGTVLAASNGAPTSPGGNLVARWSGAQRGAGPRSSAGFDYWVSARATAVPGGSVTILVGADREPVEFVVTKVAALLAVGSPVIIALVVVGTYRLVGDESIALNLYRIAQEAVANALKHGKPSEIVIALSREKKAIVLAVKDNGTGLAKKRNPKGMGVHIMKYRAETIGAAFTIESGRPGGTIFRRVLPPG